MQQKFELIKLNPEEIIKRAITVKENNHLELQFILNFKKGYYDERAVVNSTNEYSENALFRQIVFTMKECDENFVESKECIKYHLVYLDFMRMFNCIKELKFKIDFNDFEQRLNAGDINKVEFNYILSSSIGINYYMYFLFKNGLYIQMENDKLIHFVPFEGSSSMMRESRVTFIDESIKKDVVNRLMLGMDFTFGSNKPEDQVQVPLHKFFSYRGNYMSDGIRIETNDELKINENTVIVIDDAVKTIKNQVPIITAKPSKGNSNKWEIENTTSDVKNPIKLNPFDGEGLICPEYAKEINKQLFRRENGASSYQIRLPFIKGMLHSVDFHDFFKKEAKLDYSEPFYVKDIYGKKRDIREAKIILTRSMLKNNSWLENYVKIYNKKEGANVIDDYMKFFFEQMEKYNHSLYVLRTDANLNNARKEIKLNYQFLSTLNLSNKDFLKIANGYADKIKEIEDDSGHKREYILGYKENKNSAWKYAVSRNINFLNEEYIAKRIQEDIDYRKRDIYSGHIRVSGEERFFSGDLLALLIHILDKSDNFASEKREELKKQCLCANEFRMPEPYIQLKNKKSYGFLRNPHLSRNEECVLNYVKEGAYDAYFSHLSGVVMVGFDSLSAMTLGGADFDGDMVKIVSDTDIVKAIRKGKKTCKEIVLIPSIKEAKNKVPESMTYAYIKDTFGSQVGQISNMAIALCEQTYFNTKEDENIIIKTNNEDKRLYVPADCTLLTGLEIDAAKSGNHPSQNIKEINTQLGGTSSEYIKTLKELRRIKEKYILLKDTRKSLSPDEVRYNVYHNENKKRACLPIEKVDLSGENDSDSDVPNIEMLPSLYMETRFRDRGRSKKGKVNIKELFNFGNEDLDNETIDRARAIIDVYGRYKNRLWFMRENDKIRKKANWYGKVRLIIKKQYWGHSNYEEIVCNLECVYLSIERFILGTDNQEEYGNTLKERSETILQKIKDEDWIFTRRDKRKKKLYEIIPSSVFEMITNEESNNNITNVLTNFSESGYMILYYIVKDIMERKTEIEDIEEYRPIKMEKKGKKKKNVEESDAYKNMYINAFNKLNSCYLAAIKNKYSLNKFKEDMMDIIYSELIDKNLYGKDFYYINPPFFWNLYNGEKRLADLKESGIIVDCDPYKKWKCDINPDTETVDEENYYEGLDFYEKTDEDFEETGYEKEED